MYKRQKFGYDCDWVGLKILVENKPEPKLLRKRKVQKILGIIPATMLGIIKRQTAVGQYSECYMSGSPRPPGGKCMPNTTGSPRPPSEMCMSNMTASPVVPTCQKKSMDNTTGSPRPPDEICMPNTTGSPRPPGEMCMPETAGSPAHLAKPQQEKYISTYI